jgi:hypothetical protein
VTFVTTQNASDACFVIIISSMIPACSVRSTDSVEILGSRVESEEGVDHSVAVAPRKLKGFLLERIVWVDSIYLLRLYHMSNVK